LAINSADDERNPPETGTMQRELKRVKNGKLYLIPASEETRGHGTAGMPKFWKEQVRELFRDGASPSNISYGLREVTTPTEITLATPVG
jgi:hypothetical protein